MVSFIIELVQSILLIVAAIIILIVALGILRLDDDMDKVIYVRIHMLGMADIALVLAMIGLGQFLLAGIYFVLAPFVVHAMANAYYYGEDERKYEINDDLTGRVNDNIHNKLALGGNTTIDAEFKSNFKSTLDSNIEPTVGLNVDSGDSFDSKSISKSDIVSYTKSEESKGVISDKLNVVIKEVSTDDIENTNLNKDKEEKDD